MADESKLNRRDFVKVGLYTGGALAAGIAFPATGFAATNYLTESFVTYNLGDGIISAAGNSNWQVWNNENDFVRDPSWVGTHPCAATSSVGTCRFGEPLVDTFPAMGFSRTARMDPNCNPPGEAHTCNGANLTRTCQNKDSNDFFNEVDPNGRSPYPCNLWACTRGARTNDARVPTDRYNYQAYMNIAFDTLASFRPKSPDSVWDHLVIFLHVKRRDDPQNVPVGQQIDYYRIGCAVRLAPNLLASQRCFLQITNPKVTQQRNPVFFSLPGGGGLQDRVMYTLGISIKPGAILPGTVDVRAAVQVFPSGAVTDATDTIPLGDINWITNPAVAIGFVSNCGALIHVGAVVAQNLP